METFSSQLAICAGNSPVPGKFPTQRPVTRSFDVFFDLRLNNGWVNNGEAGDLRRYRAHYDVTVMRRSGKRPPSNSVKRLPGIAVTTEMRKCGYCKHSPYKSRICKVGENAKNNQYLYLIKLLKSVEICKRAKHYVSNIELRDRDWCSGQMVFKMSYYQY